jgi:ubiquinone biosynthesis protein
LTRTKGKISNIKRLRQIVNAFVKHGLGHMVKVTGLDTYISIGKRLLLMKNSQEQVQYTNPQRVVMVFEELGPTFIKLGQILSTRKDQIPEEYIAEFEKLQDSAEPLAFEKMNTVFEAEFGEIASKVFDYIDETPMASASIGQVHAARLKTGEEVVVKIRKPGIEHVINADIKILYFLAQQIKKRVLKDNKLFSPVDVVREFEAMIKNELDFSMEGKNIERFQRNFENTPEAHFPKVYWEYSSPRVLVMERIKGIPIGDVERLQQNGHDLKKIAGNLFNICLKQLFIDSFFHADFHPGNIIIMENDVIGIIDCGMVGTMEEYFVNAFIDCFVGIFLKDYNLVVRGYMAVGSITEDIDIEAFKRDIRGFADHYMSISLNTVSISKLLNDGIDVALRNNMKIPAAMFFTSKALITVEGTIRKIDPTFDFVDHSARFAKTLVVSKKFDPKKITSDMIAFISGMSSLAQDFPSYTSQILSMIKKQKIGMNITVSVSDSLHKKLNNYAASISLALISAGLGIASSLVIQAKINPLIYGISALGLFGYLMAVVLALWVVLVITKKNR